MRSNTKKTLCISIFILAEGLFVACSTGVANPDKNNKAESSTGNDMYYEYTITSHVETKTINSSMKIFLSGDGNIRTEIQMGAGITGNGQVSPTVVIGQSGDTTKSIIIDDDAKTYTIHKIDPKEFPSPAEITSTVTKAGEEKIMGFNCIHARIISVKKLGSFVNSADTLDIWKSNDVPVDQRFKKLLDNFESRTGNAMYSLDAVNQLKAIGCTGFIVRMEMRTRRSFMHQDLVKAEHRNLAGTLFRIPAGYKQENDF